MRRADRTFYELCREYGEPVDIYVDIQRTTDLDTGIETDIKTRIRIKYAVVTSLAFKYKFSALSDNQYEKTDSVIIVLWKDLKRYQFGKEDYFVVDGKKYLIVTHELIKNDGHIFVIRGVQNESPYQELTINIRHDIGVRNDQS